MENVRPTVKTITGGELALLLCGLVLGVAVSVAGATFGSRLIPNPKGILGFLGALLIGLIAGWIVGLLKRVPVSKYVRPIMPILIIPIALALRLRGRMQMLPPMGAQPAYAEVTSNA